MHPCKLAFLVVMSVLIASCAQFRSQPPSQSYYFKDTVDGNGSDTLNPGCHVEYLTSDCDDRKIVGVKGDKCFGTKSEWIEEYTDKACHRHHTSGSPADISASSCKEICGSRGGKCETVANACVVGSITADSAKCVCD